MDRQNASLKDDCDPPTLGQSRLWWGVFLGLCGWQAWLVLTLFASPIAFANPGESRIKQAATIAGAAWERVLNDEPIVSGQHPLHLYFGYLGAQSIRQRGTPCCYDPAFQAGYPKTPVFDAGSRPAELFLYLAGSAYCPRAYKVGLVICCALVPAFLMIAARASGLARGTSCVAVAMGLMVGWGTAGRASVEAGDLDLMLGGIAGVCFVCLLLACHRAPHAGNWTALLLVGCVGWFAHPCLWLLLVPSILVYYVSVGTKHRLGWHLALLTTLTTPLLVNSFWLLDWVRYWWIRLPPQLGTISLKHRTIQSVWACPLWGDFGDRSMGIVLLVLALTGIVYLNQTRQRVGARVLGLCTGALFALTLTGLAWEPLGRLGAVQLLTPALWFAILPAMHMIGAALRQVERRAGSRRRAIASFAGLATIGIVCMPSSLGPWLSRWERLTPFTLGLSAGRREIVELLRTRTSPNARILWEDVPSEVSNPRWSALLPVLTDRAYIGGLAADDCIEHAHFGLVEESLLGRHISTWTDTELADYCRRYNVGWVVAWSPAVVQRLREWQGDRTEIPLQDDIPGVLFNVGNSSLVLRGKAQVICVDRKRIALADVVPDAGIVVLSLHYETGLRASPSRIQLERERDPFDPIDMLRLRVPAPTPLITIEWEVPR